MPNIKLYPSIEEVFENPSEFYKAVFFPLLTVDLASINKGEGKVHFITVFGNGDPEIDFPEPNLFGYNFIKFNLKGDKYIYEGKPENIPNFHKAVEWYKEAELIYKEHKDKYETQTDFTKQEDKRRQKIDFDYSWYISGVINYWLTRDKFLETGKFIQGNAYSGGYSNHERKPYEALGSRYKYNTEYFKEVLDALGIKRNTLDFIGGLKGYNYSELGEDEVLLFVTKDKTEVIIYFDWS